MAAREGQAGLRFPGKQHSRLPGRGQDRHRELESDTVRLICVAAASRYAGRMVAMKR
ncbi:putative ubiquitination network signaling protein [Alternaria alternata]|nr:putative ubiquitination network signaling protein [Alternaria alternata]